MLDEVTRRNTVVLDDELNPRSRFPQIIVKTHIQRVTHLRTVVNRLDYAESSLDETEKQKVAIIAIINTTTTYYYRDKDRIFREK